MKYYIKESGKIDRSPKGKVDSFEVKNCFNTKRQAKIIRDLIKKYQ